MNLFRKAEPAPEPPQTTGKDLVRKALRTFTRFPANAVMLGNELQIGVATIESFIAGTDNLSDEQINAVLAFLGLGGTIGADGLLHSTAKSPEPVGGYRPEPFAAKPFSPKTEPIGQNCYPPNLFPAVRRRVGAQVSAWVGKLMRSATVKRSSDMLREMLAAANSAQLARAAHAVGVEPGKLRRYAEGRSALDAEETQRLADHLLKGAYFHKADTRRLADGRS